MKTRTRHSTNTTKDFGKTKHIDGHVSMCRSVDYIYIHGHQNHKCVGDL